ncbi:unnamed protein product [Caenorhabditis angaria]|uniref:Uncharacterized protein n=1 Tax=Caenorhabditis angaria TaxID=860376 RepID=A0A9P1N551_9PELO|nr:unnamed protein product [Caenorhabditis angaria]
MERCVFKLNSLLHGLDIPEDELISLNFQSSFPESIPRFPYKYPIGKYIELNEDPKDLEKYSISVAKQKKEHISFREKIRKFLLGDQEANCSFWAYTNYKKPFHYYTKTAIEYLKNMGQSSSKFFPRALIIGQTTEKVKSTCTDLFKGKSSDREARLGIKLLDPENHIEEKSEESGEKRRRRCDIIVGSSKNISEELKSLYSHNPMMYNQRASLIVIENCEEFVNDVEFVRNVMQILNRFHGKCVNILFFCRTTKLSPSVFNICEKMIRGNLVLEIEELRERDMFDYIRIHQISSAEELQNDLLVLQSVDGTPSGFQSSKYFGLSPEIQKIDKCMKIVNKLISIRESINERRHRDRNEKILIVTENVEKANSMALILKIQNPDLLICSLTRYDDVDNTERVNFEFRSDEANICVVDWRSIHEINRGIVDSVIFVDLMEPRFCKTIFEDEMERLITRDAVKLKIHVLLNKEKDLWVIPKLAKLIKKYQLSFPSDFEYLVAKHKLWVEQLQRM